LRTQKGYLVHETAIAIIFVLAIACLASCDNRFIAHANRVVVVQPFTSFPAQQTAEIVKELKQIQQRVIVNKPIPLPASAYYVPRNRYKADSIITCLRRFGNADTVVLGLTNKDISTTKSTHADWGIMGLGYTPGPACVVSSYRLRSDNYSSQLYKLVLHELGHTQGLPHCSVKSCYMRDAEGGNHLQEEIAFCEDCKTLLSSKGWQL
jgi:archaemetzincin